MKRFWLVVEDSDNDLLLLRRASERLTIPPILLWVKDGMEAKDYLIEAMAGANSTGLPSLILSDLNMPIVNGLELLSWVKKQQPLNDIPFILLTNSLGEMDRRLATQLSADAYLIKPGNLNGLVLLLEQVNAKWDHLSTSRLEDRQAAE